MFFRILPRTLVLISIRKLKALFILKFHIAMENKRIYVKIINNGRKFCKDVVENDIYPINIMGSIRYAPESFTLLI